jgi:hypothetical protein
MKDLRPNCSFNVLFLYNDTSYRQTVGIVIRYLLGCIFSYIFMSNLEENLSKGNVNQTHFYRSYVDDIFIVVDQEQKYQTH